jgi:hypothetical protein
MFLKANSYISWHLNLGILLLFALFSTNVITLDPLSNFVLNFSLVLVSLLFNGIKKKFVLYLLFFLTFLMLNLIFHYSMNFEYLISQINHYLQIPFYIIYFVTFFNVYHLRFIKIINNNSSTFTILFGVMLTLFFIKYEIFFFEFNLLIILLLLSFSPLFYNNHFSKKYPYIILIIILAVCSSRLTMLASIIFFLTFYFYTNRLYISFIRFFSILLLAYPFLTAFFISTDMLEFFLKLDHNTYFRLQALQSSGELIKNDVHSILFGMGFGVPYRESISNGLSSLHHFSDTMSLYTIPNHNSVYDFFYRFGLLGITPLFYLIHKTLSVSIKTNYYANQIIILCSFVIFQISFNPWVEDQNQLTLFSFLVSFIFYLYRIGRCNLDK